MKPPPPSRATMVFLPILMGLCVFLSAEESGTENKIPEAAPPPIRPARDLDPFAETPTPDRKPTVDDVRLGVKLPTVLVRLEVWETPALELAKRLDGINDAKGVEQLRADFLSGKAVGKLIASPSVAMDSWSDVNSEAITERIYPTEYEPSESTADKGAEKKGAAKQAFAYPSAFETRNTGQTFEASARQVTAEANAWDVAMCFEAVEQVGDLSYGNPKDRITMPIFTTFRAKGIHRLREGRWQWASIQSPPKGSKGENGKRWVCLLRVDPL